jgi:hypothetical protein
MLGSIMTCTDFTALSISMPVLCMSAYVCGTDEAGYILLHHKLDLLHHKLDALGPGPYSGFLFHCYSRALVTPELGKVAKGRLITCTHSLGGLPRGLRARQQGRAMTSPQFGLPRSQSLLVGHAQFPLIGTEFPVTQVHAVYRM